jgi:hypothetical protein
VRIIYAAFFILFLRFIIQFIKVLLCEICSFSHILILKILFNLVDIFDVSASRDKLSDELTEGGSTPYITSSAINNGVTSFFEEPPTNKAGTITANRGGSVGYFFYQPVDYLATPVDVRILTPKFKINTYIGLFLKTILQLEKYRYNFSRKMGTDRLNQFKIRLPSKKGSPDFEFMENYIKSLPYSASL